MVLLLSAVCRPERPAAGEPCWQLCRRYPRVYCCSVPRPVRLRRWPRRGLAAGVHTAPVGGGDHAAARRLSRAATRRGGDGPAATLRAAAPSSSFCSSSASLRRSSASFIQVLLRLLGLRAQLASVRLSRSSRVVAVSSSSSLRSSSLSFSSSSPSSPPVRAARWRHPRLHRPRRSGSMAAAVRAAASRFRNEFMERQRSRTARFRHLEAVRSGVS